MKPDGFLTDPGFKIRNRTDFFKPDSGLDSGSVRPSEVPAPVSIALRSSPDLITLRIPSGFSDLGTWSAQKFPRVLEQQKLTSYYFKSIIEQKRMILVGAQKGFYGILSRKYQNIQKSA